MIDQEFSGTWNLVSQFFWSVLISISQIIKILDMYKAMVINLLFLLIFSRSIINNNRCPIYVYKQSPKGHEEEKRWMVTGDEPPVSSGWWPVGEVAAAQEACDRVDELFGLLGVHPVDKKMEFKNIKNENYENYGIFWPKMDQ